MGHRMSELRIVLFIAAVLALAAFMARHWSANAGIIRDPPRLVASALPPPDAPQLRQAQLRSVTGASLRVAAGF